jgi:hypothetical protein
MWSFVNSTFLHVVFIHGIACNRTLSFLLLSSIAVHGYATIMLLYMVHQSSFMEPVVGGH